MLEQQQIQHFPRTMWLKYKCVPSRNQSLPFLSRPPICRLRQYPSQTERCYVVTLLLPILSKLCKTDVDLLKPQIWGKTTLLQEKRHRIDLLASVHTVLIFESMIWRGFWNSSSWPEEVTSGSNSWYMKLLAILSKFHFVESLRNSERKKKLFRNWNWKISVSALQYQVNDRGMLSLSCWNS